MATTYDLSAFCREVEAASIPGPTPRTPAPPPSARSLAQLFFGPYEMLGEIGSGGVARVFRVRHVHPAYAHRPMALKLLQEASNDNVRIVQLFRREAGVQSLIRHANIVETYEAGLQDGHPFLAMEFVLGGDLDHLLARMQHKGIAMPPALAAYIACELLGGLQYAHALKDLSGEPLSLVHRDVNPANCFLSQTGDVKLGDFGVASIVFNKRRREAEIAGKSGYFAPEHLRNEAMDARADLYGLGATLFEMLAARRLYVGADDAEVIARNEQGVLPDMEALLPPKAQPLLAVLTRALQNQAKDRFASATEMREALAPLAAPAKAARLLLTSLVRHFFAHELARERRVGLRNSHREAQPLTLWRAHFGHAPRVALALDDAEGAQAMTELLQPLGYDVFAAQGREGAQRSADVILLAYGPTRSARRRLQELPCYVRGHTATIMTSDGFALEAAEQASDVRARDMWIKPFRASRVAETLEDVLAARLQGRESRRVDASTIASRPPFGRAILAVGPAARAALAQASLDEGDLVTFVTNERMALEKTVAASFDVVVIDATAVADVASFLERFRGAIGMGSVPAVGCMMQAQLFSALPPRFVVARADDDIAEAISSAQKALASGEARAHTRFDLQLPVRLRFGGREFQAQTVNISRRGLLLSTPFLPSVGTELGLHIELPPPLSREVVVSARAQRAILRTGQAEKQREFETAQLGVALGRFSQGTEQAWVQLIISQPSEVGISVLERAARWLKRS